MAGRLGIDFGTSNTVVAVWDEGRQTAEPLHLAEYGRPFEVPALENAGPGATVSLVPSLIHYEAGSNARWVGDQVMQRNLYESNRTFRWMKRFIAQRSPAKVRLDGREVTWFDAGRDFLQAVLNGAVTELGARDEEIAFTLPVEAYEHYENWLMQVGEALGFRSFRFLDEPSAAALGYGTHIQPGDLYFLFDCGGGTLDTAVVLVEEPQTNAVRPPCRILGKSGTDLGGSIIDQWLFEEVVRRSGRSDHDEEVRQLSRALLVECERAKERLSKEPSADVKLVNPATGCVLSAEFTRAGFEEMLDAKEAFTRMDQTISRALNAARDRGYDADAIKAVLMIGGTSLIPCVQRHLQRRFGRERVRLERPLDAVARGAAAYVAGVDFYDFIQHDYAIRFLNPSKGAYEYRVLVKRGTSYPSKEPIARITVKATYDRQPQLGIAIFELGESPGAATGKAGMEIVFDAGGCARMMEVTSEEDERRRQFWLNENCPTFLVADPPAHKGEARFEVEFSIDANKRLLLSARDLRLDRVCHRDFPVVKLV